MPLGDQQAVRQSSSDRRTALPSGPITSRNECARCSRATPSRPALLERELEGPGPAAAARGLVDREVTAQQERASVRHRRSTGTARVGRSSAISGATIVIEWYAPSFRVVRTSARTRFTGRPARRAWSRGSPTAASNPSRAWTGAAAALGVILLDRSRLGRPAAQRLDAAHRGEHPRERRDARNAGGRGGGADVVPVGARPRGRTAC